MHQEMNTSTDCNIFTKYILPQSRIQKKISCCDGTTVVCDSNGKINALWFNNSLATGIISQQISMLSDLRILNVTYNNWAPNSLPDLGALSKLEKLSARQAQLTGPFPTWLSKLENLQVLTLENNTLTGQISDLSNLKSLQYLDLGFNQFEQATFPSWIFTMQNLQELYLDEAKLRGPIFPEITQLTNLDSLSLYKCEITGQITPDIGKMIKMNYLVLDVNHLTGDIPNEISQLSYLQYLDLSYNNLNPNVPPSIQTLPKYNPQNFFFDHQNYNSLSNSTNSTGSTNDTSGTTSSSSFFVGSIRLLFLRVMLFALFFAIGVGIYILKRRARQKVRDAFQKPNVPYANNSDQFNNQQQPPFVHGNYQNGYQGTPYTQNASVYSQPSNSQITKPDGTFSKAIYSPNLGQYPNQQYGSNSVPSQTQGGNPRYSPRSMSHNQAEPWNR
ncbi:hypothetical protein HDV06_006804 [Boothiomyces sp. JEL0866]|nr:hypothetical protein HDV06_006804 [Boothiomyces sp. JEL0866]